MKRGWIRYLFKSLKTKELMAERVGFEPTCRLPDKTLSRRPRYDHFGTSPYFELPAPGRRLQNHWTGVRERLDPPCFEKPLHQCPALGLEHPANYRDPMIERRVVQGSHCRRDGTGPWLGRTIDECTHSGVDKGAGTHETGLYGHIECRARHQSIVVVRRRGRSHCLHLGVSGGVGRAYWLVESCPDDLAVRHDHRAHWHFPDGEGSLSFDERPAHPMIVGQRVHVARHPLIVAG